MITDFLFDGKELSSFGYIICSFDAIGFENIPVSELTYHTVQAPFATRTLKTSASYDSSLSKTITICKQTCDSSGLLTITADDISQLSRWLCRRDYKWFRFITDDSTGMDEVYYEAQINLQKVLFGDRCVGLSLTVNTNRPYGLTPEITIHAQLDQTENPDMNIHVYSDEEGYIYPELILTLREEGTLKITHSIDGRITRITDCTEGECIHIHGGILQIESNQEDQSIFQRFNYQFPRLCSTLDQTANILSFNLDCDVELKYRGIRKAGI